MPSKSRDTLNDLQVALGIARISTASYGKDVTVRALEKAIEFISSNEVWIVRDDEVGPHATLDIGPCPQTRVFGRGGSALGGLVACFFSDTQAEADKRAEDYCDYNNS